MAYLNQHEVIFEDSSATIYVIHIRDTDEAVLNITTGAWDAYVDDTTSLGSDYVYELSSYANDKHYRTFPTNLPLNTLMEFRYYQQIGASASVSDLFLCSLVTTYDGAAATDPGDDLPGDAFPSVAEVKRFLNIASDDTSKDAWLVDNITDVVRRLEKRLGRFFKSRTVTEWVKIGRVPNNCALQGNYSSILRMTNLPVVSISEILVYDEEQTDYDIDIRGKIGEILINPSTFGNGWAKVTGVFGYADVKSADEAPHLLVKRVLARLFAAMEDPEKDYPLDFTEDELREIDSWRLPWMASSITW